MPEQEEPNVNREVIATIAAAQARLVQLLAKAVAEQLAHSGKACPSAAMLGHKQS